jgi:SAM-dependent methyltransferase
MAKRILHAGCGTSRLPQWLDGEEVRLDINPAVKPDVVASLTDLSPLGEAAGTFDAVFCCHALEHLYPQDVGAALAEFHRVLKPGGAAIVWVPDLEDVKATEEVLYQSDSGPVTGLDMIYGMRKYVQANPYMAHHCGFVQATLGEAMRQAGFAHVEVHRAGGFELIAIATKGPTAADGRPDLAPDAAPDPAPDPASGVLSGAREVPAQ